MNIKSITADKNGVQVTFSDGTGQHWESLDELKLAVADALARDAQHQLLLLIGEHLKADAKLENMSAFAGMVIEAAQ